jgi:cytochrome c peroxidase
MKTPVRLLGFTMVPLLWIPLALNDERSETRATPAELGRSLFWDPILSGPRDIACATCHHPDFAWADGRDLSRGTGSVGLGPSRRDVSNGAIPVVKRNSPTILNVAYNGVEGRRGRRGQRNAPNVLPPAALTPQSSSAPMFWDSRVRSLETQALEPLKAQEEMRGDAYPETVAVDSVVARLRAIPEYVQLFEEAFGLGEPITAARLAQAIAAFERTLVGMNSPFDRFRAGDANALTAQQRRGMQVFDEVGCDRCHEGVMFSDFDLHAEGVRENPLLARPDTGGRRFRFRTPSLRNVALTAPYMHNGMLSTLPEVLRFYDNGRSENPNVVSQGNGGGGGNRGRNNNNLPTTQGRLDGQFRGVDDMSDGEMRDIIAFLEALTDTSFDRTIPMRVPSGLPPGGVLQTQTR